MSEKCCNNNNSDIPLTSRCTDGGKNVVSPLYPITGDLLFKVDLYGETKALLAVCAMKPLAHQLESYLKI